MSFNVEVGVRQGCVMSPWLFNIYMDGYIREMKVGVRDLGARETAREQTINFAKPYRVGSKAILYVKYGWGKRNNARNKRKEGKKSKEEEGEIEDKEKEKER